MIIFINTYNNQFYYTIKKKSEYFDYLKLIIYIYKV